MSRKKRSQPATLRVRLFGGLQVLYCGRSIGKFESQKSRGLFVYLLLHRHRTFGRELLADLFWPEQSPDAARRNLRQAVYSLRRDLSEQAGDGWDPLTSDHQAVGFNSPPVVWVDVEAFHEALPATRDSGPSFDPEAVSTAVLLYSGDFLAGFHVKNCPEFEDWMTQERESLREAATAALRRMVGFQLEEGGYALGIRYARQLLRLDPLAEDMYRKLMRLYAFSGRRERALSAYGELCRVLEEELGVEPQDETVVDYLAIINEALPGPAVAARAQPAGPLVPMVGREKFVSQLRRIWLRVQRNEGATTLLTGAAGTGKTRLLRSFLHEASEGRPTLVLSGTFHDHKLPVCMGGLGEALRNAVAHEMEVGETLLRLAKPAVLSQLSVLVPELRELSADIEAPAPSCGNPVDDFRRLKDAVSSALEILSRPKADSHQPVPVILFLDDLQWADPGSLELLEALIPLLPGRPVWILAALRKDAPAPADSEAWSSLYGLGVESMHLKPLEAPDVAALVGDLVVEEDRERLLSTLAPWDGFPLPITEQINLLWDRGRLKRSASGMLRLATDADLAEEKLPRNLSELYQARVSSLPASTRRLLMLAAVCGQDFDAQLLQAAEHEHETVIETGLQVLLEHRLIRHLLGYWADSLRQRDIALWASGPRKGLFTFVHPSIRPALYQILPEHRRRVLHHQIAEALEERLDRGDNLLSSLVASHYLDAWQWDRAVDHLLSAVERAMHLGSYATAGSYLEQARTALEAFREREGASEELLRNHQRILEALQELPQAVAM